MRRTTKTTFMGWNIAQRDGGWFCFYCGAPLHDPHHIIAPLEVRLIGGASLIECSGRKSEVDHLTPVCMGGSDHIDNLVLACEKCNGRKGGKTADEFLFQLCRETQAGI